MTIPTQCHRINKEQKLNRSNVVSVPKESIEFLKINSSDFTTLKNLLLTEKLVLASYNF